MPRRRNGLNSRRFPGAAQHVRRDRLKLGVLDDPGSAVHRFALHRIRETQAAYRKYFSKNRSIAS
jgi:hypothetical protein